MYCGIRLVWMISWEVDVVVVVTGRVRRFRTKASSWAEAVDGWVRWMRAVRCFCGRWGKSRASS